MNSTVPEIPGVPAPVSAASTIIADASEAASPFAWLTATGAMFEGSDIASFGDPAAESRAALEGDILVPLADRRVLRARGADADAFLQGQLSNDLRELSARRAQLSSYSTPKGRVLALFVLLRRPDAIWLETQASVAAATLKRLRMFVLRSKLTLDDAGDEAVALGLSGPNAASILAEAGLPAPEIVWGCIDSGAITVVRRPGRDHARYTLHGSAHALADVWPRLAAKARPAGTPAWRLLDLLAGLPAIHPETSEQHVPQMLNLDQLEGISFGKGCYPGQEIVARLHYLGSLKRRLFVGHANAPAPARGTPVFAADGSSTQPVGDVLDHAANPDGSHVIQLVLQLSHRDAPLRLGAPDGPVLTLFPP